MFTNSRRASSNQNNIIHNEKKTFFSVLKKNLFKLQITDIEKKGNHIIIAVRDNHFLNNLFHNIGLTYVNPDILIKNKAYKYFSVDEKNIIMASYFFNSIVKNKNKYSKVTFGDKTIIHLKGDECLDVSEFVIDEKNFLEMMVKYKNKEEVRKFIREVFKF